MGTVGFWAMSCPAPVCSALQPRGGGLLAHLQGAVCQHPQKTGASTDVALCGRKEPSGE